MFRTRKARATVIISIAGRGTREKSSPSVLAPPLRYFRIFLLCIVPPAFSENFHPSMDTMVVFAHLVQALQDPTHRKQFSWGTSLSMIPSRSRRDYHISPAGTPTLSFHLFASALVCKRLQGASIRQSDTEVQFDTSTTHRNVASTKTCPTIVFPSPARILVVSIFKTATW